MQIYAWSELTKLLINTGGRLHLLPIAFHLNWFKRHRTALDFCSHPIVSDDSNLRQFSHLIKDINLSQQEKYFQHTIIFTQY